jgi:O-acetyl-ADP-ribose deacetylase (regulator of RNase III)
VDGAIHNAAGPELLEECRKLDGCETGQAKITKGYKLPAKYVIHTVGPVWRCGTYGEEELLSNCYKNSLEIAAANGIKSIAFPSISTGVYRYPVENASQIALKTVKEFIESREVFDKIVFVLFSDFDFGVYNRYYHKIFESR